MTQLILNIIVASNLLLAGFVAGRGIVAIILGVNNSKNNQSVVTMGDVGEEVLYVALSLGALIGDGIAIRNIANGKSSFWAIAIVTALTLGVVVSQVLAVKLLRAHCPIDPVGKDPKDYTAEEEAWSAEVKFRRIWIYIGAIEVVLLALAILLSALYKGAPGEAPASSNAKPAVEAPASGDVEAQSETPVAGDISEVKAADKEVDKPADSVDEPDMASWGEASPTVLKKVGGYTAEDHAMVKKWSKYFSKKPISNVSFPEKDKERKAQAEYRRPVTMRYSKASNEAKTRKETYREIARNPVYGAGMADAIVTSFPDLPGLDDEYQRVVQFAKLHRIVYKKKIDGRIGNQHWINEDETANKLYRTLASWLIELLDQEYEYSKVERRETREQWGLPTTFSKVSQIPKSLRKMYFVGDKIPRKLRHTKRYTAVSEQDSLPAVIWIHKSGKKDYTFGTGKDNKNFRLFKAGKTVARREKSNPGGNPGTGSPPAENETPQEGSEPKPGGTPKYTSPKKNPAKDPVNNGNAKKGGGKNKSPNKEEKTPDPVRQEPPKSVGDESNDSSSGKSDPPKDTQGGNTDSTALPTVNKNTGNDTITTVKKDGSGNQTTETSKPADKVSTGKHEIAE